MKISAEQFNINNFAFKGFIKKNNFIVDILLRIF